MFWYMLKTERKVSKLLFLDSFNKWFFRINGQKNKSKYGHNICQSHVFWNGQYQRFDRHFKHAANCLTIDINRVTYKPIRILEWIWRNDVTAILSGINLSITTCLLYLSFQHPYILYFVLFNYIFYMSRIWISYPDLFLILKITLRKPYKHKLISSYCYKGHF